MSAAAAWLPRRWRRRSRKQDRDRGSAAAYLIIMLIPLLAMAGLVFDGGRAIAARGEAETIAQQAARSGADALGAGSLRTGTSIVDPLAASAAAQAVLTAAGVDGTVQASATEVTVTVTVSKSTALLSLIGKTRISGTASATARPVTNAQGG